MSTAPPPPVLRVRDLACGYGGTCVLEAVDLELRAGELVALLGASGGGKSTLLRALAGLDRPQRGHIELLGEPLQRPHPRAGLLFQRPGLLPWLDCAANVGFGLGFRHQPRQSRAERAQRVAQALAAVGLSAAAGLRPAALSGGMAQRAALARALARQPALLLADEPFSALDPITRTEMQALLRQLVRQTGCAALLVTHDVDEALALGDQILLLARPDAARPARLMGRWSCADAQPPSRERLLQALRDSMAAPGDAHAAASRAPAWPLPPDAELARQEAAFHSLH
ncbi:ATP-binding cassette domain-containing protein [Pelomonas sp. CA6]|uniref:ABC transporter ATP-binding protein n=1 Tax=Pelomonas sp. CA6 TaxID=2907999 RepID=UPI001F4A2EAA|nr:ATP-binding cassette domain-containing protein [Pelomonas sp. CA6]MCH7342356.1 ATP-binding cassette domain-containing protein [Pelomonas sp. CA6]